MRSHLSTSRTASQLRAVDVVRHGVPWTPRKHREKESALFEMAREAGSHLSTAACRKNWCDDRGCQNASRS